MPGPEARYILKVHRQLLDGVYKQSMTGVMGNNGTPDRYYEGCANVLWIEYKAIDTDLPKIIDLLKGKPKRLTPLQNRWLTRADFNDVPVAVVLGSNNGSVIFTGSSWAESHESNDLRLYTPEDIAEFTENIVLDGGTVDNWQS